jgi:hypothetical protein
MGDEGLRVPGDDVVCVGRGREEIEGGAVVGRYNNVCKSLGIRIDVVQPERLSSYLRLSLRGVAYGFAGALHRRFTPELELVSPHRTLVHPDSWSAMTRDACRAREHTRMQMDVRMSGGVPAS